MLKMALGGYLLDALGKRSRHRGLVADLSLPAKGVDQKICLETVGPLLSNYRVSGLAV